MADKKTPRPRGQGVNIIDSNISITSGSKLRVQLPNVR